MEIGVYLFGLVCLMVGFCAGCFAAALCVAASRNNNTQTGG